MHVEKGKDFLIHGEKVLVLFGTGSPQLTTIQSANFQSYNGAGKNGLTTGPQNYGSYNTHIALYHDQNLCTWQPTHS